MSFLYTRMLPGLLLIVTMSAVVVGVLLLDPPAEARKKRIDAKRITDLQAIARAMDLYWQRHHELPLELEALTLEPDLNVSTLDPELERPYGYQILDSLSYELCAQFLTESLKRDETRQYVTRRGGRWVHPAGEHCFLIRLEQD